MDMMSVKMDDKVDELKIEIEKIKCTYSDILQGNDRIGVGGTDLLTNARARAIKIEVNKVMEREKRKSNLVIFGIDETNDEMVKVSAILNVLGMEDSQKF